jgi:chemotaxis signal transduction protein
VTEEALQPDAPPAVPETEPLAVAVAPPPELVVFSCAGVQFAVPLLSSREVVPPQPLTRLPGCGPEVAGLVGLRGRVITVFDMGVVLGLEAARRLPDHRILVLDYEERVMAVLVDAIVGIAREQGALLQPLSQESLGRAESVRGDVVGVGALEGQRYFALDPDRILKRLLA